MINEVLHSRRGNLISILRGLELQISKDKQTSGNPIRLEQARAIIEEELQLRLANNTYKNTSLE